jgi:replication factor C subunit 2/4
MSMIENIFDDEIVDVPIKPDKNKKKINKRDKIPWVEKYRPTKIDDIMYQDEVKKMLKHTFITGNLPHLLFYGPPGTGKTSTILALSHELFGPYKFKERVLELNASDERGINVVRKKIGMLAKTALGSADPRYPSPRFRIIILDEADAMTIDAQSALRKTIEEHSDITRFCFICNYINQIIDPITSRCVKFRFKPIPLSAMITKLKYIANKEGIKIDDECLKKIIVISDGDLRMAITLLQNTLYIKIPITPSVICEIANIFPDEFLQKIEKICIHKKTEELESVYELAKEIRRSGFPLHKVIRQINTIILKSKELDDKKKALILLVLADSERKLIDGCDQYIQMLNILMTIKGVVMKRIKKPITMHLL